MPRKIRKRDDQEADFNIDNEAGSGHADLRRVRLTLPGSLTSQESDSVEEYEREMNRVDAGTRSES
jgi:hypothetical protein